MSERDDDLTGAYALDALTPEERSAFERRLAASESLRTEVGELTDTAARLGLAVPAEAPPASLKAGLMAQIAQTPQLPAQEAPSPAATPAEAKAQARWFRRPAVALAAAAAAVALVIGGGVLANITARSGVQQEQADQLAALNAADDVQHISTGVEGGGNATLVYSVQLATSAVILDGVAELPADRTYELWYIDDAGARPAGLMDVDATASNWRVLDGEFSADDVVGVTVEPAGGSEQPTTDPIVVLGPEASALPALEQAEVVQVAESPAPVPTPTEIVPPPAAPEAPEPPAQPGSQIPAEAGGVVSAQAQVHEVTEEVPELTDPVESLLRPITDAVRDLLRP